MISQKSADGKLEHGVSFTIRDEFSGAGISSARKTRSLESNRLDLKQFVGRVGATRPNIICKSDAAKEITGAVSSLGWLIEPSLQNRFPHNAVHERWIGTLKSVIRASILQSGFPEKIADWCSPYAAIALAIAHAQPAMCGNDTRRVEQQQLSPLCAL